MVGGFNPRSQSGASTGPSAGNSGGAVGCWHGRHVRIGLVGNPDIDTVSKLCLGRCAVADRPSPTHLRIVWQRIWHHAIPNTQRRRGSICGEYLSKEGMEFMWGESGRGSPARKEAYESWLNSPGAPAHAKYYLDALDNYAVTGRPYQTLGSGEVQDVFSRNMSLVESGDMTVDQAIENIIAEGTPILEAAAKRLQGS